jgi:hypothetical protein
MPLPARYSRIRRKVRIRTDRLSRRDRVFWKPRLLHESEGILLHRLWARIGAKWRNLGVAHSCLYDADRTAYAASDHLGIFSYPQFAKASSNPNILSVWYSSAAAMTIASV